MVDATRHIPDEPPPELRYRRRVSATAAFRELWRARSLVQTLVERDLRVRYKQAYLGFAWALAAPVATLVVFIFLFQEVVEVETSGVPFVLFSYVGLLSWNFASQSLNAGASSLIGNVVLLNKVYCPREVFPLSAVSIAGVDALTASVVLIPLFIAEGFTPRWTSVLAPVVFLVHLAFVLGLVLLLSSVIVFLRDLRHAVGLILQLGLFVTPVGYSLDAVPEEWRAVYCALNPLAPVIDGYRRTILEGLAPDWWLLGLGAISSVTLLVVGYRTFKRLETGMADVL